MASADSLYTYNPSHALPIAFANVIGVSLVLHILQNFRYAYWRITFFMFWGGTVFMTGWILRTFSTYNQANLGLYIAQSVCIYGGPPIYSAAGYNILGRLMHYLPMHAPLNPDRVLYFFIYLGVLVESLTAAGAARIAAAADDLSVYKSGGTLITIGLVLQAMVESIFAGMVAWLHRRCVRSGTLPRNVRTICIMLYGTSVLVILRCVFRAIEAFSTFTSPESCSSLCQAFYDHEWYVYAFEAAPMVLYTYWLNIIHPGRFLPRQKNRYLDMDGTTERYGPGWIEQRATWWTFVDPFDIRNRVKGETRHEKFWEQPDKWPACDDGSFVEKTATNTSTGITRAEKMNS
ncbi:uncharacterized protein Z518_01705 [Rhinocladiella mackenziei CBS 650.93]|uniref:RTA1 domain protein n=1 Tax=Rhinocladiella mackenziei CBS 650.93 TaxID=1442369 RepID=A0A0D2J4J2_9EURO|nr:uncharacterized protein Z518_01705 [Rhinocladiella mackenziei CBS 650.93]KIX10621.1 hypothetical protein Z518_01705 [Rhinocladiella mackenziei CBS 650.93]